MKKGIRATVDIWISRIGSVFGWFWGVLYALVAVVAFSELPEAKDRLDRVMPFVCLGMAALHFLIVRASARTRRLVSDFRCYAMILAQNKSITALSEKTKEPREQVEKKLMQMCRRGYFRGHVDTGQDLVILEDPEDAFAAKCPGCGATTKIYRAGGICRYCGNPLVIRDHPEGQ